MGLGLSIAPVLCFLPVPTSVSCDSESLCVPPHFPQTLPTCCTLSSLVFRANMTEEKIHRTDRMQLCVYSHLAAVLTGNTTGQPCGTALDSDNKPWLGP